MTKRVNKLAAAGRLYLLEADTQSERKLRRLIALMSLKQVMIASKQWDSDYFRYDKLCFLCLEVLSSRLSLKQFCDLLIGNEQARTLFLSGEKFDRVFEFSEGKVDELVVKLSCTEILRIALWLLEPRQVRRAGDDCAAFVAVELLKKAQLPSKRLERMQEMIDWAFDGCRDYNPVAESLPDCLELMIEEIERISKNS